jgi:hypothetical protein
LIAGRTGASEVFDYRALRLSVGIVALLLPIVLPAGEGHFSFSEILSSISAYYHSGMRNVFVGSLCAIATFFFAYKGKAPREAHASRFACLFALGVAFFPTPLDPKPSGSSVDVAGLIHGISAGGLFLVLALFCFVFFQARFKGRDLTAKEKRRRTIYRACGGVIVACIVLIGAAYFVPEEWRQQAKPVFFLEQIALVAFAISWFTAGKWGVVSFLVDEPDAFRIRRT